MDVVYYIDPLKASGLKGVWLGRAFGNTSGKLKKTYFGNESSVTERDSFLEFC
jgi:hypothetical protein